MDIIKVTSNNQTGGVTAGIVNIFQKATPEEKTKVLAILSEIDPANNTIYSRITSP